MARYETTLREWNSFCEDNNEEILCPKIASVLEFLTKMFQRGLAYSSICSARSALSSIVSIQGYNTLADHPLVKRFIKGIFNRKPPQPRYTYTWDVKLVFDYMISMGDNESLTLKNLTHKLVMLLMLCVCQRANTILAFDIEAMDAQPDKYIFYPSSLLKHQGQRNVNDEEFVYEKFEENKLLCPVETLNAYLTHRRVMKTGVSSLILTYGKPHRKPADDTLRRWVKCIMIEAGVDTKVFKPHSCRSASSSKAGKAGATLDTVLKYGSWKNVSTFTKFYYRDIIAKSTDEVHRNMIQNVILETEIDTRKDKEK